MCSIFGCILREGQAADLIISSLKRLEDSGYDSVGVVTINDGALHVRKDQGKLEEVVDRLRVHEMGGRVGVGHTRWATHGAPSMVNAHPHLDGSGRVAVVHNGVIGNYLVLREELTQRGHVFVSKTDTEVVPHLVEEELGGIELEGAVLRAVRRLKGCYALVVASSLEPEKLLCVRQGRPLVLGVGEGGVYCASDVAALLPYTRMVCVLKDGEMAELCPEGYRVIRVSDGSVVDRGLEVAVGVEATGSFDEVSGLSNRLGAGLFLQSNYVDLIARFLDRGREVFLVGEGPGYHACLAASYIFSKLSRLTVIPVLCSEFVENYGASLGVDSVVLALSQSGESPGVLEAVDYARMRAATVLGVTNTVGSTLTRVSRAYVVQQFGSETSDVFVSQVLVLSQIAHSLAKLRGKVSQDEVDEFEENLLRVPRWVEATLEACAGRVRLLAERHRGERLFLFLGRGISSATALEGRLRLLEYASVPALAYPAGESKHGPISVIEKDVCCIFVCPRGETRAQIMGSIMEMKARGAWVISVCEEGDKEIRQLSDDVVEMPGGIPELLSPIPYSVPLHLLALHLDALKDVPPDTLV